MYLPKYFDNFSPEGGCSEDLDAFRFSLKIVSSNPAQSTVCQGSQLPGGLSVERGECLGESVEAGLV